MSLLTKPGTYVLHAPAVDPSLSPAKSIARALLILLAAAFLLRAGQFGNPVIQIDEQFYLLVGDRMLHGALPYVDLWDRKPIGLFIIYSLIRTLGGEGIVQYQIVATLFAAATAMIISLIASRISGSRGALLSGLAYLVYLMLNGGDGGQAPVFYNLPVAVAVLCALRAMDRERFDRRAFILASAGMLLFGMAMQIKYSALFEGVFVGIALLAFAHFEGVSFRRIAVLGAFWCGLALLPTAIALLAYWQRGYLSTFIFANFISILLRPTAADLDVPARLFKIALHVAPLAIPAFISCSRIWRLGRAQLFISGWVCAAITGLLIFGTYHDHYALPLLVPLSVASAPLLEGRFRYRKRDVSIGGLVIGIGILASAVVLVGLRMSRGDGTAVRNEAAVVRRDQGATLFVFSGDPIAYYLSGAPIPTAYAFPTLLSERRDASSMGIDQMHELERTMATNPRYVMTKGSEPPLGQAATWRYMRYQLSHRYTLVSAEWAGHTRLLLYRLSKTI